MTPELCPCHGIPTATRDGEPVCTYDHEGADDLYRGFLDLIDPEREHTGDDE